MAWFFFSNSRKQDETGDKNLTSRMQAVSAPAMIVFAGTLVFSSFDYLMSLEPLWFSEESAIVEEGAAERRRALEVRLRSR